MGVTASGRCAHSPSLLLQKKRSQVETCERSFWRA
jgi:hypothetical protein